MQNIENIFEFLGKVTIKKHNVPEALEEKATRNK